jgi:hypothetical protein
MWSHIENPYPTKLIETSIFLSYKPKKVGFKFTLNPTHGKS